ncbi:aminoglycoside phosphotransferase [Stutzerimonas kirkiae]|uniref:Aminoglycoside phosphotransferase n=2 Tax=Stutzerimonas kirkiae TaxID=2211392 RepID=A0A4Q9R145_9GAMM|nr:aminoglycoside phosphotransferase [Stutzerimonas kirkiae]TBV00853.1 aminoglycoside phosphotransferase [Stutzerimonas kirkiae]TBV08737.1 aminoglycoside phosphotransferase [Stutzerimonas kirkiae]TBV11479.1 aminoglycoside phosphotransferase [Stutzerimonas kirkiae]
MYETEFMARLESALRRALPAWDMPPDAALRLLSISENATYLAEDKGTGQRMVLRMQRPEYHSDAEIESELAWVDALRKSGLVRTAEPLRTKTGQLLYRAEDGDMIHRITAFEWVAGNEPDQGDDLVRWYRVLGATNARLHQHSRHWRKPAGFVRKVWNFDTIVGPAAHWGDWRTAPGLEDADIALLGQVERQLRRLCQAYGQDSERFGLVHCDMRLANLLVDGEQLCVVDFDDCGLSWYLYDFAACVSFLEHDPRLEQFLAAWLEGYRGVCPLDESETRMIPAFIMLRRLQLTAWIASHAETPTAQSMGADYVRGTVELARNFLARNQEAAA